jgi:hypothetical protein
MATFMQSTFIAAQPHLQQRCCVIQRAHLEASCQHLVRCSLHSPHECITCGAAAQHWANMVAHVTCLLSILQLLVWLVMLAMWWVESYHTQMRTKLG